MASVYTNDLRLEEIGSGEQSGTWGDTTNTNLELIAESFSFGTEAITTNADTHTTTIADGATDPGRSMFLKYTGTLDSACTITIGPNTVSKLWFIENGTSGSQNIIISQGSGANITIPPGDTKAIYSDGAGSGAAMVDAFASLNVVDLKVQDDLTVTDDVAIGGLATFADGSAGAPSITNTGDLNTGILFPAADTVGFSAGGTERMRITTDKVQFNVDAKVGTNDAHDLGADGARWKDLYLSGTANITGVLTTTASAVFNGGFTSNGDTVTFASANSDDPLVTFKNTTNNTSSARVKFVKDKGAAGADGDDIGQIDFVGDNDAQQQTTFATILAEIADASDGAEGGKLSLRIAAHDGEMQSGLVLVDGNAEDEIDFTIGSTTSSLGSATGSLLVGMSSDGVTSTGVGLIRGGISHIYAGDFTADTGGPPLMVGRGTNDGPIIEFNRSGTTAGGINIDGGSLVVGGGDCAIGFYQGANALVPYNQTTNQPNGDVIDIGTDSIRWKDIYLSGNIIPDNGKGIDFSAQTASSATNASTTSELLDHYEEGTWRPVVKSGSTAVTLEHQDTVQGTYTKIGRLVSIHMEIDVNNMNSATGLINISGLPFTVSDNIAPTGIEASGSVSYFAGFATSVVNLSVYAGSGNVLNLQMLTGAATGTQDVNGDDLGTGEFRASIIYFSN